MEKAIKEIQEEIKLSKELPLKNPQLTLGLEMALDIILKHRGIKFYTHKDLK